MKSYEKWHGGELVTAALRYSQGKTHLQRSVVEVLSGIDEYYQCKGFISDKQREFVERFLRMNKVKVSVWLKGEHEDT